MKTVRRPIAINGLHFHTCEAGMWVVRTVAEWCQQMMRLWIKKCAGTDTGLIRGTGTVGKLDKASVLTVIKYTDR